MSFKNFTNNQFLLILLSSLTLIVLSTFSSNLVQSSFADSTFTAAGDWECNSRTDDTVDNMAGKNPDFVFGIGDYSYASTGNCWWDKLTGNNPSIPVSKTKIAIGNHEDDDSEGFSGYVSHFGLSQTYYSYDREGVHVLVADTDRNSYSSGSAQRNFVQNDLQSASSNPNVKWIILYLHKPMYTSPNSCGSSSCSNTGSENTNIRNWLGPLIDQYGVDLVLQGHVHDYQRTYTLKYDAGSPSSPTITSNNANTYTEGNGAVYAIIGTAGASFHPLSGKASFTSSQQDDFNGQMQIKVTDNGNKLEGKFYQNVNNNVLDSFTITKAGNSAPVANNQAVTTNKNTAKPITLTATDANNDPLTYTIVTPPAHGTISGGTGAARTYTPTNNYVGPDSFTFKANDGTVDSNTATVSITVQDPGSCGNNLPISSVTASGSASGYPATNAIDNNFGTRWNNAVSGSTITADLGSAQSVCSVDIAWYSGNTRQYHFVIATSTDGTTFSNKFSGDSSGTTVNSEKYSFASTTARYVRVTVNGNTQNSYASMFEIDIFGISSSSAPVANNQVVTTNKDTAKSITLTATDPNNDPLTYTVVAQPAHGTITAGTGAVRTYTPTTGYVGPDSFTFKANDGTADSNIATVSITVQDAGACTTNLPISAVTASGSASGYPATNAIDNNFGTRWNNALSGSTITADLGSSQSICSVDIAWYSGNTRQYHFVIATSTDGNSFSNKFSGDSSGTTVNSEKYSFASTNARYVRVTVNGNTQNSYASMYEIDIFGTSSLAASSYNYGPSLTLSGPP